MKNKINLSSKLKINISIVSMSCCLTMIAQQQKPLYKAPEPAQQKQVDNFVPDSKYGRVVTLSNLTEALKNPSDYKAARFTNARLTTFPDELFLFPNLVEVDVSRNAITVIPARLKEMKYLKDLFVNKNRLTEIGSEITSLTNLEVLMIQCNPLESISKEIGKMNALKELTIGEVPVKCAVPKEVWDLKNLKVLRIMYANLTEIPPSISEFKHLDELCLMSNSISELPEELFTLKNITYLNFGFNKIKSIPPSIKALENLDYLGVFYNPLTKFPDEIGDLKKLSILSCWKTNLPSSEVDLARKKLPKANVHDTETDIH